MYLPIPPQSSENDVDPAQENDAELDSVRLNAFHECPGCNIKVHIDGYKKHTAYCQFLI